MHDFVGRTDLMKELRAILLRERGLVLVGPRRIGKSRLLEAMEAREDGAGTSTLLIRVTLEGLNTVESAIATIRHELSRRSLAAGADEAIRSTRITGAAGIGVEHLQEPSSLWWRLADDLDDFRKGHGADTTLTIALDEAPWWLDTLEQREAGAARTALAGLRSLRDSNHWPGLRWIFTGSVGLAGRALVWRASAEVNDLPVVVVPPLSMADGMHLVDLVAVGLGAHPMPEAAREVWRLAGGRPFWIRVLAERASREGYPVTASSIDGAVNQLLQRQMRHLFDEEGRSHFERLYTEAESVIARIVLDILSESLDPLPEPGVVTAALSRLSQKASPSDVRSVIDRLTDEFYIDETNSPGKLCFALPLFGLWWSRWST